MKRVEALKKAVFDGTYAIPAEDLAPKLMESMFRNTIFDEAPSRTSASRLKTNDQLNPQQPAALEVSCADATGDSPGGSAPKRGPRRAGAGFGPTAAYGDDLEVR
jgi:Anti-sigma-28 factor, FlgM